MKRSTWVIVALAALVLASEAHAAFPGQNGKIAFHSNQDGDYEIYSVNPDGTGLVNLTNNTVNDVNPSWSPDGDEIVFTRPVFNGDIWKMNANGSGQVMVLDTAANTPSWSPDGERIAFSIDVHCDGGPPFASGGIWAVNADGTDATWLTCGSDDGACCTSWSPDGTRIVWHEAPGPPPAIYRHTLGGATVRLTPFDGGIGRGQPDWSPNGNKIVFEVNDDIIDPGGPIQVYAMNPDGSSPAPVRVGGSPAWSPDGAKIVFVNREDAMPGTILTANADGSNRAVVSSLNAGGNPSWQPIPINSYPRPKGATPFRVSLTTAYNQCNAPDRTHGPPLAFLSCASPQKTSQHLTVGTGDSNGLPARNEGYLRLDVIVGVPGGPDDADVGLDFFMDDVFTNALADYTGELRARVVLQITDKDNTPHPGGPGAATTIAIPLELTATCTPVTDPQEGSACTATTTADALAPGTVKEGRRSVWHMSRVEVYDGGPDGDAQTPAGDTLFATQGVFVP